MRFLLPTFFLLRTVAAKCCSYNVTDGDGRHWIYTEAIETEFSDWESNGLPAGWIPQEFNVSAEDGRGKFGKSFLTSNVINPPLKDGAAESDEGVRLMVGKDLVAGAIGGAEIDTARLDLHWGSFRAGLQVTDVPGTCAAFFWYFNDTQEIDIEFLSHEFDRTLKIFPINLVVQTEQSLDAGYDASKTGNFKRVDLPFDPSDSTHEYRFDYVPGRVIFFADGEVLAVMDGKGMPSSGGHLILQHWSNGNPLWSGGPPEKDAYLTVDYVHAYFNTSSPKREDEKQCSGDDEVICDVGDVMAAGGGNGKPGGDDSEGRHDDTKDGKAGNQNENGQGQIDEEDLARRLSPCSSRLVGSTVLLVVVTVLYVGIP